MDDLAISKDVESVKAKGRRFAYSKYVACYLALAAVLLSHQPVSGISKRSVADERPRLIIHPLPQNDTDSRLIRYRDYVPTSYKVWVDELDRLTKVYYFPILVPGRVQNTQNCADHRLPSKGKVCDVDVSNWGPCSRVNYYNYHESAPCVFLELNQIPGWVPDYYNRTTNLPAAMPSHLKDHIAAVAKDDMTGVPEDDIKYLNTIWITCDGVNPADVENIGPIMFYPRQGFPGYFYPYENTAGYLSPLVAVQFERPRERVLINIECKVWATNINHDQHEGLVRFELMID